VCLCVSLSVISCKNNPLHHSGKAVEVRLRKEEELFLIYKVLTKYQAVNTINDTFNWEYNNSVAHPTKLPNLT